MIHCDVCSQNIEDGTQFVAVPNPQGLLTSAAHLGCAPQDHKFDGATPYSMTIARAGVIATHILKANGLQV